jgi:hypothetical protein
MIDLEIIRKKHMKDKKVGMRTARIVTIIMGILAAWGVQLFIKLLGGTIFNFVYVLIVAQLSLLGPIVVGLVCKPRKVKHMWIAIALPVVLGISSNIIGAIFKISALIDAAGTISALSSVTIAFIIYLLNKKRYSPYMMNTFN